MSIIEALSLLLAAGLTVYLVVALLKPEKFQ
jgi:K+-transporting ATPase KdpF subunit